MNRKIMTLAAGFAMLAMQAENPHFSPTPVNNKPIEDWKRKKCKSCKSCGSYCNPYNYKGKQLIRYSKPNYQACAQYQKK